MTFIIASVIIVLVFIVGALAAWVFKGWDKSVTKTKENIEIEGRAYNPALTMGYSINSQASSDEQIKEARKASAKQAAALPRGANARIGYKEDPALITASKGLDEDPWTASKIAQFHGWDGAKAGIPAGGVPVGGAAVAVAVAAPAAGGKITLVPGKDYPVIEITDDMSAEDKRKARIANSKAKSAAMKKAKAAGVTAAPAAVPAAAQVPAAAAPVAVAITAPTIIELTDDMAADEKRKARIANSKAKSAFNKQLKAAGIDPKSVEIDDQGNVIIPGAPAVQAAAPAQPSAAPAAAPTSGPVDLAAMGIAAPVIVELTDDMPADEKRKARINNSKAKSAFNKQLKAAGIDPKSVKIDESGQVVMKEGAANAQTAAPAAPTPVEAAPPASTAADGGSVDLAAVGITPPELVELTDDMSPDEKRQARIANSKAKSAFNKQLKAAGIDPKSVKL